MIRSRRLFAVVLSSLAFGVLGCPEEAAKKDDDSAGDTKKAKPAASGSASASGTASGAVAAPPREKFELPPIELKEAKEQELGGKKLKATVCLMDTSAGDMRDDSFSKGIRGVVAKDATTVFVLDHEGKVRKYTNKDAAGCKLELDAGWGTAGVLTVDQELGDKFDTLAIDKDGNLYLSGFIAKAKWVGADGKVADLGCKSSGRLLLDPGGTTGFLARKKIDVAGGKCELSDWEPKGWPDKASPSFLRLEGGDVLVGGTVKKQHKGKEKNVYTMALHAAADGAQKFAVGDADGDGSMCNIGDAHLCGLGVCVLDANCRAFRIWDKGGKLVGKANISDLAGVGYPWPVALAHKDKIAWMAMTHKSKDKDDKNHYGFIVRIDGLME